MAILARSRGVPLLVGLRADLADLADGEPVTIRTLDAGGDKLVPGLTVPGEANPFLGIRGIRLSLSHPQVFRTQLRALARAAALGAVKVMLPMVTVPEELKRAREMLQEEVDALVARGIPAAADGRRSSRRFHAGALT